MFVYCKRYCTNSKILIIYSPRKVYNKFIVLGQKKVSFKQGWVIPGGEVRRVTEKEGIGHAAFAICPSLDISVFSDRPHFMHETTTKL